MSKLVQNILMIVLLSGTLVVLFRYRIQMNEYRDSKRALLNSIDSCETQFDRMQKELYTYPTYPLRHRLYDSMAENIALRSVLIDSLEQIEIP